MNPLRFVSILVGMAVLAACSSDNPGDDTKGKHDASGGTGTGGSGTPGAGKGAGAGMGSGVGGTVANAGTSSNSSGAGGTTASGGGGAGGTGTGGAGATGGTPPMGGTGGTGGTGVAGSLATGGSGVTAGMGAGGSAGAGAAGAPAGGSGGGGALHWVGTWTASPYLADSSAQPPAALSNSVLRQVTHISIGGSQFRFQFSNAVGNGSVAIKSAHIALCKASPAVDGSIDTSTDKALAFSGMPNVTLNQGQELWSDPVDFTAAPLSNITITMQLGSVPSNLTAHAGARTNSYVQANGTDVSAADLSSSPKGEHWYFISGTDVMAPANAVAVVAIGDSITDGRGTDTDHNNRWTDVLSARLQANEATKWVAMLNQGIGATNLMGTGTAAEARFARDVLAQSGVKYAIILDGVNDIGNGHKATEMEPVYAKLVKAGHDKSVTVYGGTITPFGDNTGSKGNYYTADHEKERVAVNAYIKTSAFDGFIDFDAALTDGGSPPKIKADLATWAQEDGLHPGPAGYAAMGNAADLTLFTK
ncbi:MAG TPA: GDSL-type esterase/lipase family protein [Polyangiaceae bacterium]|nr:GDSL-type esterase/lipase family protein [Polyangiaceae bacterium]